MDNLDQLVHQAEQLFKERKLEEAFQFYKEAAFAYRQQKDVRKAAHCFSQAAHCEKIRTGLASLLEAANYNEMAAQEYLKAKDYALARWLFRDACLLYEREGDFEEYSRCYVQSQDAFLEYLWHVFISGKKQSRLNPRASAASWAERLGALGAAFFGLLSKIIWGYGEQPFRTVLCGLSIIVGTALIYTYGGPLNFNGVFRHAHYHEALYMSGITFSTVGFGDITPLGWLRFVALLEALSGFLMAPMLIIALTRRYLRVYR